MDNFTALCAGGPDHRSNMQWITVKDLRVKTFVDVRECRKLRAAIPVMTLMTLKSAG